MCGLAHGQACQQDQVPGAELPQERKCVILVLKDSAKLFSLKADQFVLSPEIIWASEFPHSYRWGVKKASYLCEVWMPTVFWMQLSTFPYVEELHIPI